MYCAVQSVCRLTPGTFPTHHAHKQQAFSLPSSTVQDPGLTPRPRNPPIPTKYPRGYFYGLPAPEKFFRWHGYKADSSDKPSYAVIRQHHLRHRHRALPGSEPASRFLHANWRRSGSASPDQGADYLTAGHAQQGAAAWRHDTDRSDNWPGKTTNLPSQGEQTQCHWPARTNLHSCRHHRVNAASRYGCNAHPTCSSLAWQARSARTIGHRAASERPPGFALAHKNLLLGDVATPARAVAASERQPGCDHDEPPQTRR